MAKRRPTEGKVCEPCGTLYDEDGPLFFRQAQGTASDKDGEVYEMSTNVSGGAPILRHLRTKRTFVIGWQEIIDMAEAAGIAE
jgi:hypothetical protein